MVRIADTEHANFTDFTLLSPLLIGTPLLGSIDPTHGLDLINLFVKAFFDKYLLQKEGIASIKMLANEDKLVRLDSKNVQ